jgi:hypothetical protein
VVTDLKAEVARLNTEAKEYRSYSAITAPARPPVPANLPTVTTSKEEMIASALQQIAVLIASLAH